MPEGLDFKPSSIQAFKSRIREISDRAKSERKQAVREVAELAIAELNARNKQMKKINKQDSLPPGASTVVPVSKETKVDRTGINAANNKSSFKIIVAPQWVKVRDGRSRQQEAYLAMQAAGDPGALQRTQLAIKGKGWKNTKLVDIATFQNLNAWCHRPEKGYQIDRHQLYLTNLTVMDKIIMTPVVKSIEVFAKIRFEAARESIFG